MAKQKQQSTYEKDLAHISNPNHWALWPFQTVKRNGGVGRKDVGIIIEASDTPRSTVFLVNYFALADLKKEGKWLKDVDKIEYPTIQAMLADGWEVD